MHMCRLQRRVQREIIRRITIGKQVEQMDKETRVVAYACQNNLHCVARFFKSKSGGP
jgi:excinuclease UvrABC nuclease subunit